MPGAGSAAADSGVSVPADSAAVRDALRSLAQGQRDGESANSLQSKLKKVVAQVKSGGHVEVPAAQSGAPTAVEKALKQLREMQSP